MMKLFPQSQQLSQIMKPLRGKQLALSQFLNSLIVDGSRQNPATPAEEDANNPINILFGLIPLKSSIGLQASNSPCKFLQLRQTSLRYSILDPGHPLYQLLQAWIWQISMQSSANLMIGTKQFQYTLAIFSLGTGVPWQTVTHSGVTISSLQPRALFNKIIVFATVLGVAAQYSKSKSAPSKLYYLTAAATLLAKLFLLCEVAKAKAHFPLWPPTERKTFLPYLCHLATLVEGKLSLSTTTFPSALIFAKASMMQSDLGLTSSNLDWPQNSLLNPQQNMDRSYVDTRQMIKANPRSFEVMLVLKNMKTIFKPRIYNWEINRFQQQSGQINSN